MIHGKLLIEIYSFKGKILFLEGKVFYDAIVPVFLQDLCS